MDVASLHSILPSLPSSATDSHYGILVASVVGVVAGAAFWLAGVRVNRSLLTLVAVALGTGVGLRLPRWFGWPIDSWATGVGGALVLGVSAYVYPRLWTGLAFGGLLAVWATVLTVGTADLDGYRDRFGQALVAGGAVPFDLAGTAGGDLPPRKSRRRPLEAPPPACRPRRGVGRPAAPRPPRPADHLRLLVRPGGGHGTRLAPAGGRTPA